MGAGPSFFDALQSEMLGRGRVMEATGNEGQCVSVIVLKPPRASLSRRTKTDSIVGVEWAIILRILSQMTRTS